MFRWDPQQYQHFSGPRSRPYGDLIAQIGASSPQRVIDLGCGDGTLTSTLRTRWPDAEVLGVDSSAEMLDRAAGLADRRLRFHQADVTTFEPDAKADVVLSNALFQWVPEHIEILRRWVGALPDSAWFAFQVPGNFSAPSHELMRELVALPPWRQLLPDGVLRHEDASFSAEQYAAVFLDQGWQVDAWETTYVHLLTGADPVLEWVRGTGLRPVLAALPADAVADFEAGYATRLRAAYPTRADGVTPFAFRRIFCVAHGPAAETR